MQHEEGVVEDFGGARVELTHDHFAVHFAHHADIVASNVEVEVAQHGDGFEEGAAFVGDVEYAALTATEEENLEVVEANHDEGVVDIAAAAESAGEGVLELEAGEAFDMKLSENGEVDVSVDVDQVVALFFGGAIAEVEGVGQFLFTGGADDDAEFVVGSDGGLEFVFYLNLRAVGHILQVVHSAGSDTGRHCQCDGNSETNFVEKIIYVLKF